MHAPSDDTLAPLVVRAEQGDRPAREALFAALYDDLHRLAQPSSGARPDRSRSAPRPSCTRPTSTWPGATPRRSPIATASSATPSRAMRGLVINYVARPRRRSAAAISPSSRSTTRDAAAGRGRRAATALAPPSTSSRRSSPSWRELVDLKFFCGFSFAEIAAMRGVSDRTIQRDWAKARLLLHRRWRDASGRCRVSPARTRSLMQT